MRWDFRKFGEIFVIRWSLEIRFSVLGEKFSFFSVLWNLC